MIGDVPGDRIMRLDWIGTAVFVVTAAVSAAAMGWTRYVAGAVAVVLFVAGIVAFVMAYAAAVQRSRRDEMGIGGLFFLAGETAPKPVKRRLNGALTVQVVVGLATAAARPYTSLALGTLVPMFGIGLNGIWGARHGTFGARVVLPPRGKRRDVTRDGAPMDQNAGHG
jgi:hypothetical protein